jgi:hypothetical protein
MSMPSATSKILLAYHTPGFSLKAPFTVSSNGFHTQEWSNLAKDDVSRLLETPSLVSFMVGRLEMTVETSDGNEDYYLSG